AASLIYKPASRVKHARRGRKFRRLRALRAPGERGEQNGDGVVEGGVRVQLARRVVDHDGEDEALARGAEDVARERRGRAERARLGADVPLRGRALHAPAE